MTRPKYWDPQDGDRITTHLGHLDALAIQIQATMALHRSEFPTEGLTAVASDEFLEQLKREVEAEEARKTAEAQEAAAAASKALMDSLVKDVKDGGGKQG